MGIVPLRLAHHEARKDLRFPIPPTRQVQANPPRPYLRVPPSSRDLAISARSSSISTTVTGPYSDLFSDIPSDPATSMTSLFTLSDDDTWSSFSAPRPSSITLTLSPDGDTTLSGINEQEEERENVVLDGLSLSDFPAPPHREASSWDLRDNESETRTIIPMSPDREIRRSDSLGHDSWYKVC